MENNTILDQPNYLAFFFDVDLPKKAVSDGTIIYQYATLKPKTPTSDTKQRTVVCKVVVGVAAATEAALYEGTESFLSAGLSGKKYFEHDTNPQPKGSIKFDKDNDEFYALQNSTNFANKVQQCKASVAISKTEKDMSFFGDFNIELGVRLYANKDDTAFKTLTESTAELLIEDFVFEEWDPELETGDLDDVDFEWKAYPIKELETDIDMSAVY